MKVTENGLRNARTALILFSFFGLGLLISIPGPTLIDLERSLNVNTHMISYMFTARSAGYVIGSILGGFCYSKFNRQLVLIVSIFISGLGTFTIPCWTNIIPLALAMTISGMAMGSMDTGGNVCCLDLWRDQKGPVMQALHFTFGLGALMAPIIVSPFLSDNPEDSTGHNLTVVVEEMIPQGWFQSPMASGTTLFFSYSLVSSYMILVGLAFLALYCFSSDDFRLPKDKQDTEMNKLSKCGSMVMVAGAMAMLSIYVGIEVAFGQFLTTFSVKSELKLSKLTGSLITSTYWGLFALMRALSILISARISSLTLIAMDSLIMFLASIALVTLGGVYKEALCIGSGILGFGCSSFYPATFVWIGTYVQVTSRIASFFVVSGTIGEMWIPYVTGIFIDETPDALLYAVFASCSLMLFLFGCLWILAERGTFRKTLQLKKRPRCDSGKEMTTVPRLHDPVSHQP